MKEYKVQEVVNPIKACASFPFRISTQFRIVGRESLGQMSERLVRAKKAKYSHKTDFLLKQKIFFQTPVDFFLYKFPSARFNS